MKWSKHLLFWFGYWAVYAYTNARSTITLIVSAQAEALQMPFRMLAVYASFWWVSRRNSPSWQVLLGLAVINIGCGMGNRLFKWLYIVPEFYPDSTIYYWHFINLIVDIFDCVLATGVALTTRLYFQRQALLQREAALQQEKTQAELSALKNQVHPHFLFNTLNTIYALAGVQSEQTAPVTLKLANLLRFVLYESQKTAIPIEKELAILKDYIAMEQLRFSPERLTIRWQEQIDRPDQPIAPLLLLPLLENAFKHGAGNHRFDAWIDVDIRLRNNALTARISNALPDSAQPAEPGLGLTNLRRQLALVYPDRHQLQVTTQPDQFMVDMQITLDDPQLPDR